MSDIIIEALNPERPDIVIRFTRDEPIPRPRRERKPLDKRATAYALIRRYYRLQNRKTLRRVTLRMIAEDAGFDLVSLQHFKVEYDREKGKKRKK